MRRDGHWDSGTRCRHEYPYIPRRTHEEAAADMMAAYYEAMAQEEVTGREAEGTAEGPDTAQPRAGEGPAAEAGQDVRVRPGADLDADAHL